MVRITVASPLNSVLAQIVQPGVLVFGDHIARVDAHIAAERGARALIERLKSRPHRAANTADAGDTHRQGEDQQRRSSAPRTQILPGEFPGRTKMAETLPWHRANDDDSAIR